MEIDVFLALTSAGVSEAQARSAAEAIRKDMAAEIREAQKEVATKFDISNIKVDIANLKVEMANMKAELFQRIADMQRFTVTSMFGGFGVLSVLMTLFKFMG